jgi:hypothetical protein
MPPVMVDFSKRRGLAGQHYACGNFIIRFRASVRE